MGIARTKGIKSVYFFSFIAVLVFLPWSLRLNAAAIIVMTVSGLMSNSWKEKQMRLTKYPHAFIFLVFYALYLVGMIYTDHPSEGVTSLEQKAFLLLPMVAVSSSELDRNQIRTAALAFVCSNALLTLVCITLSLISVLSGQDMNLNFDSFTLARFTEINPGQNTVWMRFSYIALSNLFIHPLYLAMYLALCIAILFYYKKEDNWWIVLKWSMAIWFFIIIILLATRMGILVLCLVAALIILSVANSKMQAAFYLFLFSLILVGAVYISPVTRFRAVEEPLSTPLELPKRPDQWNSINLRLLEWNSGLVGIKNNGLLGTGTGGTIASLQNHYRNFDLGTFPNNYNAHNQYVETFLEIGLAGFLVLMTSFLIPLSHALKNKNRLLLCVVVITSLAGLTECILERAHGLIFYMAFLSLFMFSKDSSND